MCNLNSPQSRLNLEWVIREIEIISCLDGSFILSEVYITVLCHPQEMGSELNVTAVMSPWVDQMGLPVLNITQNGNQITATATRFMANPDADPSQPESDFGWVQELDSDNFCLWLRNYKELLPLVRT